ncbi:PBSX family phage terminase large subunit [Microbacterium resistens]|uniref:PBSX family phage terminase large subunit n=1 Tax=Microbacterium resistens TaxID=156977 RepID=A0ABU1SD55_9MICO|nr:PBSX family phage terminase large subunit [Microbacterium resistens]MDR6867519.1 PBSX family phage terminase large subunit [Microbacterium resistens]
MSDIDDAEASNVLGPQQMRSLRESKVRVNIFEGAIRSGKTIVSLLRFLMAVLFAQGGVIVVIARTRDSAYRNVFEPLMNPSLFGPLARLVHYTAGAPTARILGRTVHVLGASDAKSEKVLRGLTVALAYVDEVTVIPEEFFTQLLGRMSPPRAKLFGTTNPDSPAHWLKAKFLDRIGTALTGWRSWHFQLDDNPALSEEYKHQIKTEFTGLWYRRFVKGEWVAAEGAIFDMWDPEKHTIAWDDLPEMRELISVSLDYGTTNATAALLLGISAETDSLGRPAPRLFFVDEYRHDSKLAQQKLTDAELAREFIAWLNDRHLPATTSVRLTPRYTIVDPSAASFKVEMRKTHGVTSTDADNDVLYGIRLMASLLASGALLVARPTDAHPDRGCPGFIQEAPAYSWDPKATEKGEDKPLKVADHSLDGARYGITTTENIWRRYIKLAA